MCDVYDGLPTFMRLPGLIQGNISMQGNDYVFGIRGYFAPPENSPAKQLPSHTGGLFE
jgi:hypothetical protein